MRKPAVLAGGKRKRGENGDDGRLQNRKFHALELPLHPAPPGPQNALMRSLKAPEKPSSWLASTWGKKVSKTSPDKPETGIFAGFA